MDGIYFVNKPKSISSYDCIRKFKTIFKNIKIGHAGTLDPFASGLLIILVGKATKLSDYFINLNKTYEGVIKFGYSTTTYDLLGEIVNQKDNFSLDLNQLKLTVNYFIGKIKQLPPIYSAIKQDGKKLYEYARKNKQVTLSSRDVEVFNFEILNYSNNKLNFTTTVSKGTYIRSLAHDLGIKVNVPAHLKELTRTKIDNYDLTTAYELKMLTNNLKPTISLTSFAESLEKLVVKDYLQPLIKNAILLDERQITTKNMFSVYNSKGKLLAIYIPHKDKYKPLIIF